MTDTAILLVPLLVLPVVLLLAFAGCSEFTAAPAVNPPYPKAVRDTPGLVAYWRLSETGGNTAEDIGPNGHDGTYNGGFSLGLRDGALKVREPDDRCAGFDGTAHVQVFEDSRLSPPTQFTVEAWVRFPTGVAVPSGKQVLVFGHNRTAGAGFALELDRDPAPTIFQGLAFKGGTETRVQVRPPANQGAPDAWRYVVLTFSNGILSIFVKIAGVPGIFKATKSGTYAGAGMATRVGIGGGRDEQGQPAFFVVGRMDEVALYNVGLTESQVEEHFKAATVP